eukprot:2260064-Amphidinium_carterae.1
MEPMLQGAPQDRQIMLMYHRTSPPALRSCQLKPKPAKQSADCGSYGLNPVLTLDAATLNKSNNLRVLLLRIFVSEGSKASSDGHCKATLQQSRAHLCPTT